MGKSIVQLVRGARSHFTPATSGVCVFLLKEPLDEVFRETKPSFPVRFIVKTVVQLIRIGVDIVEFTARAGRALCIVS
jgi:hypothetical protein